ncbi:MAG: NAD(P)-dependent oxidoreductase [Gemmatimonadota bacterium]
MKLAFLGLGAIGTPMARHLAGRFDLTVWNRTAERAAAFAASTGAKTADTPAFAARDAAIVITCFPTSKEVEQVLDADSGLLGGMAAGSILLDCTSGDPASSRKMAGRLDQLGIGFVDAPVSGGTSGAESGTLTVMCGGREHDFGRVAPVLNTFGKRVMLVGPVGSGHALKAVNNALLASHILSAAEGLAALVKAGVSAEAALEIINASSGRSNASENLIPARVLTGAFPRTFRLALLEKDVAIAADFARSQGVPSAVIQQTAEIFRVARAELGEEVDHVEVVRLIERWARTEIRR